MVSKMGNRILSRVTNLICIAALLTSLFVSVASPVTPVDAAASLSFSLAGPVNSAVNSMRTLVAADFNLDGKNDLAAAVETTDSVSVWLGNGNGTFGAAAVFPSGGNQPIGLAAGDVNLDGKPDLVVSNDSGVSSTIGVLLGVGNGTFSAPLVYPISSVSSGYGVA